MVFATDNSIPFAKVPDILNLIQTFSKEWAVLCEMRLAITTAAYKLRFAVGTTILDEILEKVRHLPFSLHIDDQTKTPKV